MRKSNKKTLPYLLNISTDYVEPKTEHGLLPDLYNSDEKNRGFQKFNLEEETPLEYVNWIINKRNQDLTRKEVVKKLITFRELTKRSFNRTILDYLLGNHKMLQRVLFIRDGSYSNCSIRYFKDSDNMRIFIEDSTGVYDVYCLYDDINEIKNVLSKYNRIPFLII